jgi:putative transposase
MSTAQYRRADAVSVAPQIWRHGFGAMELSEAKRLRELERENSQLKNRVAELSLDNRMLRDVVAKKC